MRGRRQISFWKSLEGKLVEKEKNGYVPAWWLVQGLERIAGRENIDELGAWFIWNCFSLGFDGK